MKELRYSLKEISSDLAISINELRRFINTGELNAMKMGRAYSVSSTDLDDFLNTQFPIGKNFCREYDNSIENVKAEERTFEWDVDLLFGGSAEWQRRRTLIWV